MKKDTKSGLAKELGAVPSTVTHLIKTGVLKPLPDGLLDRAASLKAIVACTSGSGGGWDGNHGRRSLRERAEVLLKRRQPRRADKVEPDLVEALLNPSKERINASEFPPSAIYSLGAAFLAEKLRDKKRINVMGQIAHEAIGITKADGRNLAKIFAHLAGAWLVDYVAETVSPEYGQKFQGELETWAKANIPYQEERGAK